MYQLNSNLSRILCKIILLMVIIILPHSMVLAANSAGESYFVWNSSVKTYDETIYTNMITNVTAEYDENQDTISITGISALETNVSLNEEEQLICINIPNTTLNGIGDNSIDISNSYYIENVTIKTTAEGSSIFIKKTEDSDYYTKESENILKIVIQENMENKYSLKIKTPEEVDFYSITNEDFYYNNKFVITVPGNQVSFYKKNPIICTNAVVTGITVKLNSSKNTDITVKTSRLQGYKIEDKGSYFTVLIDRPNKIYKNIVVLDAGHGGHDPGARSGRTYEKEINLKIIYSLSKKYFNSPDSEVKAYWTRSTDKFVNLYDRAAFSNKVNADLFISLHMNSIYSPKANGTEVYYCDSNNKKLSSGLSSKNAAALFGRRISSNLGMAGRGIRSARFTVIQRNTVPSILVELGFLSNPSNLKKLKNSSFQKKAAKLLYTTTSEIFKKYPTGR